MDGWFILIYLVSLAIGLWILYAVIKAAVGAAIRQNAWAIRGEQPPAEREDPNKPTWKSSWDEPLQPPILSDPAEERRQAKLAAQRKADAERIRERGY